MDLAKKYGEPFKIFEAINVYKNMGEITTVIEAKRADSDRLSSEISNKEAELSALNNFIERANMAIGKIEANYERSLILQTISDLIYETETTEIKPETFLRTSLLVLTGIHSYARRHSVNLGNWDRDVDRWLKLTIEILTSIL